MSNQCFAGLQLQRVQIEKVSQSPYVAGHLDGAKVELVAEIVLSGHIAEVREQHVAALALAVVMVALENDFAVAHIVKQIGLVNGFRLIRVRTLKASGRTACWLMLMDVLGGVQIPVHHGQILLSELQQVLYALNLFLQLLGVSMYELVDRDRQPGGIRSAVSLVCVVVRFVRFVRVHDFVCNEFVARRARKVRVQAARTPGHRHELAVVELDAKKAGRERENDY